MTTGLGHAGGPRPRCALGERRDDGTPFERPHGFLATCSERAFCLPGPPRTAAGVPKSSLLLLGAMYRHRRGWRGSQSRQRQSEERDRRSGRVGTPRRSTWAGPSRSPSRARTPQSPRRVGLLRRPGGARTSLLSLARWALLSLQPTQVHGVGEANEPGLLRGSVGEGDLKAV